MDGLELVPRVLESAHEVGVRGGCGLVGAGTLILALPPRLADQRLDWGQIVRRLFVGMCAAIFLSPMALDNLQSHAASLLAHKSPNMVAFFLGMAGYFVLRWIALWLEARKDKAVDEINFGRRAYDRPENKATHLGDKNE